MTDDPADIGGAPIRVFIPYVKGQLLGHGGIQQVTLIVKLTGARIHISAGRSEITLPVRQDLFHAAGTLHGSMYFLALDNAAWFAVNSLVPDVFVLTVSFNVYLIRPVDKGIIRAEGLVTNSTRTQFFAESDFIR